MITFNIFAAWLLLAMVPLWQSLDEEKHYFWIIWGLMSLLWIVPLFTGVHMPNNQGQYKGYVTAIEQNGAIFKGWNVFLKTDLQSSNEDMACIDRTNYKLIEKLQQAQETKENVVLEYEGVWQYAIGECPGADWMIKNIK